MQTATDDRRRRPATIRRRVRPGLRPPRSAARPRSLAAVVVRSSMIAITTIARPGTAAPPTSSFCSACTTGWPRPGPSTNAAMVAIDSAASVHWLMPSTIVRGPSAAAPGAAAAAASRRASRRPRSVVGETDADAVLGDPDQRRQRVDEGARTMAQVAPMPKNSDERRR